MTRLCGCLATEIEPDLFPEIGKAPITAEMCLGAIPNYDSMAAVNLQTFLEENFPLKVSLDMLAAIARRSTPK